MTFENWIARQAQRSDQVGELARALASIDPSNYRPPRRKFDEHKKWADLITRHGTWEQVRAFNRAWKEFTRIQEKAVKPH